jgi:7-cyano-7-deazaguanine synthase
MKTMVLFSGGLDSTAALIWATHHGFEPHVLSIYYGQPAGQKELGAARAIAKTLSLGERFHRLDVSGIYYGMSAGVFMPRANERTAGLNTSFVPMRNPVLLACAAARALNIWPEETVRLVAGFNLQDAEGFPDCRPEFVEAFEYTLAQALGGERVRIAAPWATSTKAEAVTWVRQHSPEHEGLLALSWSCYRDGGAPCGECTGCVTRRGALP